MIFLPEKELLASVAAGHHMVHHARILESQLPRYVRPSRLDTDKANRKVYNLKD